MFAKCLERETYPSVLSHFSPLKTSCSGSRDILYKRLLTKLKLDCISAEPTAPWELRNQVQPNPYNLDYLCILDFEATCEEPNPKDYIHEVIEFPVILLNLKTLEVVSGCK